MDSISKWVALVILVVVIVWPSLLVWRALKASNEYESQIGSYWSLADKSSTIKQKAVYVDRFVVALEGQNLNGQHDALIYLTPDNSFDANLEALRTLRGRLHEIETMDVTSFQYQTAIQQITAQEQGEAEQMIGVLSGCWWKVHHFYLWGWVFGLQWTVIVILGLGLLFFPIIFNW